MLGSVQRLHDPSSLNEMDSIGSQFCFPTERSKPTSINPSNYIVIMMTFDCAPSEKYSSPSRFNSREACSFSSRQVFCDWSRGLEGGA
mmetsp:Transcript_22548/g.47025  ORF Transcript_22548/g.47025 Transcript_22548/m.47025 type:complete len:88 (-) Transcript_22548:358-621(-)